MKRRVLAVVIGMLCYLPIGGVLAGYLMPPPQADATPAVRGAHDELTMWVIAAWPLAAPIGVSFKIAHAIQERRR